MATSEILTPEKRAALGNRILGYLREIQAEQGQRYVSSVSIAISLGVSIKLVDTELFYLLEGGKVRQMDFADRHLYCLPTVDMPSFYRSGD